MCSLLYPDTVTTGSLLYPDTVTTALGIAIEEVESISGSVIFYEHAII